ncbi:hypothetical protein ATCC90586_012154 [Pythium insidiosum]|nr:hypothetical protein ATCC90586_012154 [Pythium insidiosum]
MCEALPLIPNLGAPNLLCQSSIASAATVLVGVTHGTSSQKWVASSLSTNRLPIWTTSMALWSSVCDPKEPVDKVFRAIWYPDAIRVTQETVLVALQ